MVKRDEGVTLRDWRRRVKPWKLGWSGLVAFLYTDNTIPPLYAGRTGFIVVLHSDRARALAGTCQIAIDYFASILLGFFEGHEDHDGRR